MTLQDYKGRYAGQRVFLMGSGHSLTRMTPEERGLLAKEYTFAGARYFKWADGILPTFYLLTEERHAVEWQAIGFGKARARVAKFWVDWQPAPSGWVPVHRPPSLSYHHYALPETRLSPFTGDCQHIHMGNDVPIGMLQVARYMGFSRFYLVGCETTAQGYAWDVEARRAVGARAATMAPLYAKASQEVGGRLWDCTPDGEMSKRGILRHIPLQEVLSDADHS